MIFDRGRMIKEGYEEVGYFPLNHYPFHRAELKMSLFLDKTRYIQSRHFEDVEDTGLWA